MNAGGRDNDGDRDEYAIAYKREKQARQRAEQFVEEKNRDIYRLRQDLVEAREQVESQQETLLQADKLRSVGQLAAGITHEINNPLAYITSNMHQLVDYHTTLSQAVTRQREAHEDEFDAELKSELKLILEESPEIFEDIDEGLQRIGQIVANVKRFARKNARERTLSDINQEISSSLRLVEKQLGPDSRVQLDQGDLPLVSCNLHEIGQVLVNLIINADQASAPRGGPITVRSTHQGDTVVLTVSDQGCGIPAELLESIFDPFFTTKPVGEGTGLGLSVSYGIIEAHGGTISVASEEGVGTTFTIVLPLD